MATKTDKKKAPNKANKLPPGRAFIERCHAAFNMTPERERFDDGSISVHITPDELHGLADARPIVAEAAERMERRLQLHDAKDDGRDWTQLTVDQIKERIEAQLRQALDPKFENDEVAKRSCDDGMNYFMFLRHKIEGRKVENRGK